MLEMALNVVRTRTYGRFSSATLNKRSARDAGVHFRACDRISLAQVTASTKFKVMSQRRYRTGISAEPKRTVPFSRLAEMEYPLAHAVALANAISLIGYGLRAKHADGAAALLAVADDLEDQLAALEGAWRHLIEAGSAQRRRTGQR
jgi:hypothetical protein